MNHLGDPEEIHLQLEQCRDQSTWLLRESGFRVFLVFRVWTSFFGASFSRCRYVLGFRGQGLGLTQDLRFRSKSLSVLWCDR